MPTKKTLHEREAELQVLITSPMGRNELETIAARYQMEGERPRPAHSSVITYIIVHERAEGLIVD